MAEEKQLLGSVQSDANSQINSLDNKYKVTFSDDGFWQVNILYLLIIIGTIGFTVYLNSQLLQAQIYIMMALLILRFFMKFRPPEWIELDLNTNNLKIKNRKPKITEDISLNLIKLVSCKVIPDRFSATKLTVDLHDGSQKEYFFKVVTYSNGFFGLPKEKPEDKLVSLAELINKNITNNHEGI